MKLPQLIPKGIQTEYSCGVQLEAQRFFTGSDLVLLYKQQILSYLEYRTAAIYHGCDSRLAALDALQDKAMQAACVGEVDALMVFNLAPLCSRRDIAMLGILHRAVLKQGPKQFHSVFFADPTATHATHRRSIKEYVDGDATDYELPGSAPADYIKRSALGLTAVYNMLPPAVVACNSVKQFQSSLQRMLKQAAAAQEPNWQKLFSPRVQLHHHPLLQWH